MAVSQKDWELPNFSHLNRHLDRLHFALKKYKI